MGEINDINQRNDVETRRNIEIQTNVKDLEARIRAKEDQIMYLKKELEGSRYSNGALLEGNSNLQIEIDSL